MSSTIRFGTDGWRGVIDEDFTFINVCRVVHSLHGYLTQNQAKARGFVVVGYDCRELSLEAAQLAAAYLVAKGHRVELSNRPVPSPATALFVRQHQADAGVMITASHNPPRFNGIKFKGPYGGSFTEEMMQAVSAHLPEQLTYQDAPLDPAALQQQWIEKVDQVDIASFYLQSILALVKIESLHGLRIIVDAMHGSGYGILASALQQLGAEVREIRSEPDSNFGGVHPEPLEETTRPLQQAILESQAHLGFCLDGDADRLCARDDKGNFVDSHRIFSLLLQHLVENRQLKGKVVKTTTTTDMIDKLCEHYQLPLQVTPVGFKHICRIMIEDEGVLLGGEESGGIGFAAHLPERDSSLMALLLCELLATTKNFSLSQHIDHLMAKVGPHLFRRLDIPMSVDAAAHLVKKLAENPPKQMGSYRVKGVESGDGVKLRFDLGWLMFRNSGTEPLLRLYAEAPTQQQLEIMVKAGSDYADALLGEER